MNLRAYLDPVFQKYHDPRWLTSDPLEFVHRHQSDEAREIVGLYSALMAYGNVKQIRASLEDLWRRLGAASGGSDDPVCWLEAAGAIDGKKCESWLQGFVHRFHRGEDIRLLSRLMLRSVERHGTIGAHFCSYLDRSHSTVTQALDSFLSEWKNWAHEIDPTRARSAAFKHLLASPKDGSCCKRWVMYLRWMGREDSLDPGSWRKHGLRSSQLVIPLDTHTGRISQYLGLTDRQSLNWKAAIEVTERLREADPEDPVKYDFALARLGILSLCQRTYRAEICGKCDLLKGCRFAQSHVKRTRGAKRLRGESS